MLWLPFTAMLPQSFHSLYQCVHRGLFKGRGVAQKTKQEDKMRYALRNQDKIAAAYSPDYLKQHLIASLDKFFATVDEDALSCYWRVDTAECQYPILAINDAADDDCLLEFAIIGRQYDVLKLAFMWRMKG